MRSSRSGEMLRLRLRQETSEAAADEADELDRERRWPPRGDDMPGEGEREMKRPPWEPDEADDNERDRLDRRRSDVSASSSSSTVISASSSSVPLARPFPFPKLSSRLTFRRPSSLPLASSPSSADSRTLDLGPSPSVSSRTSRLVNRGRMTSQTLSSRRS